MPTFVLDTDKIIEAQVQAFYPWEKTAKGLIELRWWAKKVQLSRRTHMTGLFHNHSYQFLGGLHDSDVQRLGLVPPRVLLLQQYIEFVQL